MEWVSPTFLYSHVFMYHKMCTYCIPYSHFATCTCVLLNAFMFVCLVYVCAFVIFLACMFIHTIKPLTYPYLPKTYAQKKIKIKRIAGAATTSRCAASGATAASPSRHTRLEERLERDTNSVPECLSTGWASVSIMNTDRHLQMCRLEDKKC